MTPTDTVLEVQDGYINVQLICDHIDRNLPKIVEKEKENG